MKVLVLGSTRQMVEGQLQRMLLRLGPCESPPRVCRVGSKVKEIKNQRKHVSLTISSAL